MEKLLRSFSPQYGISRVNFLSTFTRVTVVGRKFERGNNRKKQRITHVMDILPGGQEYQFYAHQQAAWLIVSQCFPDAAFSQLFSGVTSSALPWFQGSRLVWTSTDFNLQTDKRISTLGTFPCEGQLKTDTKAYLVSSFQRVNLLEIRVMQERIPPHKAALRKVRTSDFNVTLGQVTFNVWSKRICSDI